MGTASILAFVRAPVEVVAGGLIHAAYAHGDFGTIRAAISDRKRKEVRSAVGERVEEYVVRYDRLLWSPQEIRTLHDSLAELDPVDRSVLLIRLANELEHQLDLGGMYYVHSEKLQERYRRRMQRYGPMLVNMAERLGFSTLAAEMAKVLDDIALAQAPIEPWIRGNQQVAYRLVPESYRERLPVTFSRKLSDGHRLTATALHRAKLLYDKSSTLTRNLLAKR